MNSKFRIYLKWDVGWYDAEGLCQGDCPDKVRLVSSIMIYMLRALDIGIMSYVLMKGGCTWVTNAHVQPSTTWSCLDSV